MTDDECCCGRCDMDTCDFCPSPSQFVDDEYVSWCLVCKRKWDEREPPEWWLERQLGLSMWASDEARYYQRMKGESYGW